jgi:hypothetical protein
MAAAVGAVVGTIPKKPPWRSRRDADAGGAGRSTGVARQQNPQSSSTSPGNALVPTTGMRQLVLFDVKTT